MDDVDARPSDFDDPNDWFVRMYFRAIQRLVDGGLDDDAAAVAALQVMTDMIEGSVDGHTESMESEGQTFLREAADYRDGFTERLRVHWGASLDLFELFVEAVEFGGSKFAQRNLADDGTWTLLLDVLVQLNGHAVRVAREVHALLSAGFPLGAHSLSRTIHEIAVRAGVLAKFGRLAEHADLAERFVLHDHIINYRDAVIYQRDVHRLGYEPFDDSVIDEMRQRHDELIARFGPWFGAPLGWAAGLPGLPRPKRPTFEDLETLAELDHFRGIYRWSSHFVHGDSKALRLGRVERGGASAVLTNATNIMLADPGQNALIGLYRTFVSMVTSGEPFAFYDMLLCGSLASWLDRVGHMLVAAEREVDEAEERFQAELASRGLRFDVAKGEVPQAPQP